MGEPVVPGLAGRRHFAQGLASLHRRPARQAAGGEEVAEQQGRPVRIPDRNTTGRDVPDAARDRREHQRPGRGPVASNDIEGVGILVHVRRRVVAGRDHPLGSSGRRKGEHRVIGVAQRRPAHPENDSDRHRACSADEITVTFSTDAAADAGNDSIVIGQTTAIQIRPDNQTPTTGQIFRPTTGGGDATITGITTTNNADGSGGTNFGSLSSSNGALANFNVVLDPVNVKTAGTAFNIDITARDQFNNTVGGTNGGPDFNGAGNTVDLTSNVAIGAGGGTTGTFTNGVLNNHSVTLTGTNNGGTTITATDTAGGLGTGAETGTTPAFTVQPGALNNFLVELGTGGAIGTQTAGAAFNIDVTARDANNNTLAFDTNIYTGTPTLTSTVAIGAGGGATGAFVAGVLDNHSITLTGTNNGGATITATDGVATASAAFTVQPGALANFLVVLDPVATKTAGTAFNIDVTARDANSNTLAFGTNDFNGAGNTVDITSNVAIGAGGGTTGTFTNGVLNNHSVTLTGTNNGGATITATDTAGGLGTGAETGVTPAFTVQPGALAAGNVTPASLAAGAQGNVTVTFQVANPWATNGRVVIVLPGGLHDRRGKRGGEPGGEPGGSDLHRGRRRHQHADADAPRGRERSHSGADGDLRDHLDHQSGSYG